MKNHWQLALITAVVFLLWSTPVMIPLKILTVFFHEVSHGLAAVLTGGSIESISVSTQQGGVTITRGGNLFLITSAGYIGSLLIGVSIFLAAHKSLADKVIMGGLGVVMLIIAMLYVREMFALGFTVVTGLAMVASSKYLSAKANDTALQVIGLTSMIYVPFDIVSDTILRSELRSDAYNLAQNFGGATVLWGGVWLLLSLFVIWKTLKHSFAYSAP